MCILFALWVRSPSADGYRLILISNRDEYFRRPAAKASSWPGAPHIFGGMDMEPGREGGTWLASDTEVGRVGVLLNVTGTTSLVCDPPRGRGPLVTDWLRGRVPSSEYLKTVAEHGPEYSGFHLVLIELNPQAAGVSYIGNSDTKGIRSLPEGIIAIGNSPIDTPFCKIKEGRARFEDVTSRLGNKQNEETLVEELLALLKWDKEHLPDPEMDRRLSGQNEEARRLTSSLFQRHKTYGTRTHTIILVDADWNFHFHEWTLAEPIDISNPEWIYTKKTSVLPYEK